MPLTLAGATILGAGIAASNSLLGNGINYLYNSSIDKKNLKFRKEQFEYQKYLNNNQIQMQAADAEKAGINPLAMNSGSLSGGNYSNVNSNFQFDSSAGGQIADLLSRYAEMKNQKDISSANNQTSKDISDDSLSAQRQMNSDRLESEERIEQLKANTQLTMQYNEILHDTKMREEDRKSALDRLDKQISSNEKIANNSLDEQKYEFDVANERAQRELVNASRKEAIDNLSKAYQQWYIQNYHTKPDMSSAGNVITQLYNDMKKGVFNTTDMLTKSYGKFWKWYVDSGFQIDTEYHSSVRRRD